MTKGHAWGALEFSKNYTESLTERARLGRHATEDLLEHSDIKITMDMSGNIYYHYHYYSFEKRRDEHLNFFFLLKLDQQIGQLLRRDIYYAFADFIQNISLQSNVSVRVALPPIQVRDPVYGTRHPNFTDFAAPGIILT